MKRIGNLYEKIYSYENLLLAHNNAKRGKSQYKEVLDVENNLSTQLEKIKTMLQEETYQVSQYQIFNKIEKGKNRIIAKLPYFPDRIIQWALIQVVGELMNKRLIYDTYSSIKGKGIHFGVRRLKRYLARNPQCLYCLKLDISKYYQSIDKTILKAELLTIFKDSKLLRLLYIIIDSYPEGIPIGNFLSQYFANLYLSSLDRRMKEFRKITGYFRYMDDIVILHKNKKFLHYILRDILWYCKIELNLKVKNNYQVFPIASRGIDFLGYIFRHNVILLRKRIKISLKNKFNKKTLNIPSFHGWLKWCNCYKLNNKYLS